MSVPLPDIELKDIGKEEGGKPIGEVAAEIFTPLSAQITSVAKEALANAKKLLGEGAEAVKGAGKTIEKTTKGVVEGVKDIFK